MKTLNSLKTFLCMAVCFGLWSCQQIPPYQNETGAEVLKLKYKGRELPQEVIVRDVELEQNPEYAMGITIKITKLSDKVYRTEYDLTDKQTSPIHQIGGLAFPNWENLLYLSWFVSEMLAQRTGHQYWAWATQQNAPKEAAYPIVVYVGLSNKNSKRYSEQFGFNELIDWEGKEEDPHADGGMMPIGMETSFSTDYVISTRKTK